MKNIIAIVVLPMIAASCGTVSIEKFRENNFQNSYKSTMNSSDSYKLLFSKMDNCYQRRKKEAQEEGIFGSFDEKSKEGTLYLGIRDGFELHKDEVVHLIDVKPNGEKTSEVILYSKDDLFRSSKELKNNLSNWLSGQKGKCRGSLFAGEFWREV